MESVGTDEFKSPVKKLVEFFRTSRDKWKQRYILKRDESILLANKVRAVEKSRQRWSEVARAAKLEVRQVKAELQRVTDELKKICD